MKYKIYFLLPLFAWAIACNSPAPAPPPPNVLLIISDDQGWADYGFMGHPDIATPRLDQLAQESQTFTRGYVTAPLCSPSLASMMSGQYPHTHGVTGNDPLFEFDGKRYSPEWRDARSELFAPIQEGFYQHKILTEYLNEAGYLSVQTGKWWLGSWQDAYFTQGMTHGIPATGGRHGDEGLKIGREGLAPITSLLDASKAEEKPFFIWYAPFLPHAPHTPPEELEQKYMALAPTPAIARYWAMCEWFDQTCGDILDQIEARGMTENTLVVYVCDNGWVQLPDKNNRYAPRSKRSPYEMGARTPMMYKWPGKIAPEWDTTTLVSSLDIVPTILSAVEMEAAAPLPGLDIRDREALSSRKTVFAEVFDHDIADVQEPTRSMQYRLAWSEQWKLIFPDTRNMPDSAVELFDVFADPHEQVNLAAKHPDVVQDLQQQIDAWWKPGHLE